MNSRSSESDDFLAVDLHGDILLDVVERRLLQEETHVFQNYHIDALRAGNVKVQVLPIYIEIRYQPESSLRMALHKIAALFHEISEAEDDLVQIRTSSDLDQVLDSDAIGVILAFEGVEAFGRDIDLLSVFYDLGVRMIGLTWNWANLIAQGVVEDTDAGLSLVGRGFVKEMDRLGILLDVSHLSVKSFWDVLEHSSGPVLASHSNAMAVRENPRNLYDEQIKALANRDGVIGLNFLPKFVGPGELAEKLSEHAAHIASLVGVRHVALGPDFIDYLAAAGRYPGKTPDSQRIIAEPELEYPDKYPSVHMFPSVYRAMLKRGFSEEEARAIMGENAMRFLRENL